MATLADLGVEVSSLARQVEVQESIPFAGDQVNRFYDAGAAQRFWLAVVQMERVLAGFRAGFIGKASLVHSFWGGFEQVYSHEVSSCGYWPDAGAEAYYDKEFGEFLLPCTAVRTADDPDSVLRSFVQSSYEAAAELGKWDRAALERGGGR